VSLARQMWLASIVLALIVGSAFAALVVAVSAQREAIDREQHSSEVTTASLRLDRLVVEIENNLRGWTLTVNRRCPTLESLKDGKRPSLAQQEACQGLAFLEQYVAATGDLESHSDALRGLVENDAPQRQRARRLTDAIDVYVSDHADLIAEIARQDPAAAAQGETLLLGEQYTDEIDRHFDNFLTAERELAEAAAASADRRFDIAVVIGAIGFAVSTVLIVLFGVVLARSVARPVRAVASGSSRLASGDLAVRLPPKGPAEVRELTRSFNSMAEGLQEGRAELEEQNAKLRESERMKTELINIVSHELRTPLASVLGFTSLLLKREFDPPTRRHYLGIVDAQARRLAALLEDFLDVQRMEQTGIELTEQQVDLARLLDEQAQLYAKQSPNHEVRVELPERPLAVKGDANRLAQVVGNLLSNAIKYSDEGSVVALAAERHGDEVRLTVRDQGRGIPPDQQERIFTKFFRGDAGATGITGTGLGLAVSREIVEAHGGKIGFDSAAGAGSTFWVELPGAAPDAGTNDRREEQR
jgi:signal transduction histidine kinase